MLQANDIVVIWLDDTSNPYYLMKLLTEPSEITDEFCGNYGHTFPGGLILVKEH